MNNWFHKDIYNKGTRILLWDGKIFSMTRSCGHHIISSGECDIFLNDKCSILLKHSLFLIYRRPLSRVKIIDETYFKIP